MFFRIGIFLGIFQLWSDVHCIDYDGWLNFNIEHTLNCNAGKYCSRGKIALRSIRSGIPVIEQSLLTEKHLEELRIIAEEDGFYTLRTVVTSGDHRESEFISSMKAQAFLDNGLSDVISAWVLPNGAVMSVGFQASNSSNQLSGKSGSYHVNSNFYLRHVEQAPVPDTASYIQKIEMEREAREKGEVKDNRSFLAKYWMYIVPVAIFVMISGATGPEAAQAAR